MYQPTYELTDKLVSNIVKLEVAKATAGMNNLSYNLRNRLTMQTKGANLFHMAHMLGLNLTLKDAEKLAEGRRLELEGDKIKLVTNFRNVLEFNRSSVAESYTELDFTVLVHLNKIVLTGVKESWEVKVRSAGDNLDSSYDDWTSFADKDLQSDAVETAVVDLLTWYQNTNGRVNNIIRAAVLFYRLVEIMPFLSGNKYTLISLIDLLLYQFGYLANVHMPIMRNFDQTAVEYWKIWDYISQNDHDLTMWLERFTDSLVRDVGEAKAEVDKMVSEEAEKNTAQPFLDLNKRQLKILRYLQTIPTVRREDYCQMMEVSTMTAFRDMNDLVRKKLLRVDGQGRGTRYTLVSR